MAACEQRIAENTVIYKLFPVVNEKNVLSSLEIAAEEFISKLSGFLKRYIWQCDPFNLRVVESSTLVPHLEGTTCFEDNIEDEWFIVFLLFYLSERNSDVIIQIEDNDGEFLLIEAADFLPKWLNPDTSTNRVFIYQGSLHIIPVARSPGDITPLPSGTPSVSDALSVIRRFSASTKASSDIQKAVKNRIQEYPHCIDAYKHRTHCYVPCTVASLLKEDPSLLPHAVRAFYLRDPIDLKACRAMKYFPPETRVMTEVTFTRCLYAQLSHQKYEPDRRTGWNLPSENCPSRKAQDLGMKLACGFEILTSNAEKLMEVDKENSESDFCNDIRWRRFTKSLKDRGYFREEVEGTILHRRLLSQAKDFYLSSLKRNENANTNPGTRIHKLLKVITNSYDELKAEETNLRPPDDDSWMTLSPEALDSMLEKAYRRADNPNFGQTITDGLNSFVKHKSDIEGVEMLQDSQQKSKKQKINFDPDAFKDGMNAILDFRVPESDTESDSSSMDGYSDEKEEDVELDEGQSNKYNIQNKIKSTSEMRSYMDEMDRQLASTNVGLSFERSSTETDKAPLADADDDEDDDFRPVNVDLTALKNILESYSSQNGLPGPAGNLFSSLGIPLPDNED